MSQTAWVNCGQLVIYCKSTQTKQGFNPKHLMWQKWIFGICTVPVTAEASNPYNVYSVLYTLATQEHKHTQTNMSSPPGTSSMGWQLLSKGAHLSADNFLSTRLLSTFLPPFESIDNTWEALVLKAFFQKARLNTAPDWSTYSKQWDGQWNANNHANNNSNYF